MACHTREPGRRLNVDFSVKGIIKPGFSTKKVVAGPLAREPQSSGVSTGTTTAVRITTGSYNKIGKSRKTFVFQKGALPSAFFCGLSGQTAPVSIIGSFTLTLTWMDEGIRGWRFVGRRATKRCSRAGFGYAQLATPVADASAGDLPIGIGTTCPCVIEASEHGRQWASRGMPAAACARNYHRSCGKALPDGRGSEAVRTGNILDTLDREQWLILIGVSHTEPRA
jgi:hypothetical protein